MFLTVIITSLAKILHYDWFTARHILERKKLSFSDARIVCYPTLVNHFFFFQTGNPIYKYLLYRASFVYLKIEWPRQPNISFQPVVLISLLTLLIVYQRTSVCCYQLGPKVILYIFWLFAINRVEMYLV